MLATLVAHCAAAACTAPTLGVEVTNISSAIRSQRAIPEYVAGALVRVVRLKSPAAAAKIQAGDVIQAVGSQLVQNVCDMHAAIAKQGCGRVHFAVRRGNETIGIDAVVAGSSSLPQRTADPQRDCRSGDGGACLELAKQNGESVDLLRLACDLGDGEGCYQLALKLGNTPDGAAAYEQACDGGNALACTNLGWIYEHAGGRKRDLETAARLYRRGCDGSICTGSNSLGCVNLGRAYRDGIGVSTNASHALRLFREVCERTPREDDDDDASSVARACSLAGTALQTGGTGVARNVKEAALLLEKGCAAHDSFGCYNLGVFYEGDAEVAPDLAKAIHAYDRACAEDDRESCDRAAVLKKRAP